MSTRTLRTLTALLVGAIAALAPAALLAALELVMSEARRLRTRAASAEGSGEPQGGAPVDRTRPAQPGELQAAGERSSRQIVRELLAGGQDVTVERVREATGVGRRRAYELIAQVRAEGNGDGRR
ncbi:MAG TPA: hypothetical protein VG276_24845 [Actinomycetes bacterium]|jgi:hypothetical protein|nr:hypothetical protein [Actinomycetes bacterium]